MSNFTLSSVRSSTLSGGPSDCAIVRSLNFQLETGNTTGCCPGIDTTDASCDGGSRITTIGASEQNTRGPLPANIGDLAELKTLYAFGNRMPGDLPSSITKLSKLQNMWLNDNQLTGSLPDTIGNLKKLESLQLQDNKFTGPVPLLPNVKSCTLVSGPKDNNKFTCLMGDPSMHIGPCYDNLRVMGITQVCPPAGVSSSNPAGTTDGAQLSDAPPSKSSLPIVVIIGGVAVVLVAVVVAGIALHRRRHAKAAQDHLAEHGKAAGMNQPEIDQGLDPHQFPLHQAGGAPEQDHLDDLWSSPFPTQFPPPPPMLVDDGRQVQELLANIDHQRAASPRHP